MCHIIFEISIIIGMFIQKAFVKIVGKSWHVTGSFRRRQNANAMQNASIRKISSQFYYKKHITAEGQTLGKAYFRA